MRSFDGLGLFWLPGHEDDPLSGRLVFAPSSDDGINLTLVGTFDNAVDDHGKPTVRVVGWLDTRQITLDRCFGSGPIIRSPGIYECRYHANRMFVGHHFETQELVFRTATIEISDLDSWVQRTGIRVTREHGDGDRGASEPIYEMNYTPLPGESHSFSRGQVGLGFCWESGGDPIHGVRFRQWPVIKIVYKEMQSFEVIQKDVGRIQSLVTLCIDAPTTLDRMTLTRPDIKTRVLSGEFTEFDQPIEFVAPPLRHLNPGERKPRHWSQMLLTYDQLGGIATIARWLDASQGFQRALDSFMSIRHVKQIYGENRFLNVTFAAEAFHRITQGEPYMEESGFRRLLDIYLEHTPVEHHDWLRTRIEYGNEQPLIRRLRQLVGRSAVATRPLVGNKDKWAFTVARVRDELTHLGSNTRTFDGADLLYLAESVYAVVRICMLLECGVSPEVLAAKANEYHLTWYRERLKESIERVRAQFLGN